jgi:hypothetical protein
MKFSRPQIIYGCLVATIALVAWTSWNSSDDNANSMSGTTKAKTERPANYIPVNSNAAGTVRHSMKMDRDPLIEASADPFVVVNFVPPLPVPAVAPPPPPPKPTAPPLPYHFFGRMTEIDGTKTTYLQRGDELIAIKDKQLLDANYRVESIDEKQIVIMYLPLAEKTVMNTQTAENE